MLSKDEPITKAEVDNTISKIDQNFRLNFHELIKEAKMKTHNCQFLCYQNNKNLLEGEVCARNCYKPLLYSKKNIASLMENTKENFEKCRFTAENLKKERLYLRKELMKCIDKYTSDLDGMKDEVEYIYKGYMKNFEVLMKNGEERKL